MYFLGTLNGLYLWLCQRLFSRKQFARVQPLLNVILAAKLPITQSILFDCVKMANPSLTQEEFNRHLHLLRRVISVSRAGAIMLFHYSFAEWLLDVKHCTQKYLCSATEGKLHQSSILENVDTTIVMILGHAMLAMYYTLRASNLDADEICVLAQHTQGAFAYQQKKQQHHPYYQQNHHHHHKNSETKESAVTSPPPTPAPVPTIDSYTLQLLWLIGSGAPIKNCYLDSSECILWPKQDTKLLKLLVDAGAKVSEKADDEVDGAGDNGLVPSSQVSNN